MDIKRNPIACTTILYSPKQLSYAIQELAAAGYDGLELQPHHTLPLCADPAAQRALAAGLERGGLMLASAMAGFLLDRTTLAQNKDAARMVSELGGHDLLVLPPPRGAPIDGSFYGLLEDLAGHCETLGVRIGVHHHAGTIIDTAESIGELLSWATHPSVALCFDTAHYALYADDEAEAAARFAPSTTYVHVKDLVTRRHDLGLVPALRNTQQSFRIPGDGVLDLAEAVQALVSGGYDGWISVEIENFYRSRPASAALSHAFVAGALEAAVETAPPSTNRVPPATNRCCPEKTTSS